MVAIFEMPRLPTPMAMRDPARTRDPNSRSLNCRKASARTSGMDRSGKCWRTGSMRGNGIFSGYLLAAFPHCWEFVLMLLHPNARTVEHHALSFQPEALFQAVFARQRDFSFGSYHAMPG